MSLIRDEQRRNADQSKPKIKPLRSIQTRTGSESPMPPVSLPSVKPASAEQQLQEMELPDLGKPASAVPELLTPPTTEPPINPPASNAEEFGFLPESFPDVTSDSGNGTLVQPSIATATAPAPDQAVLDALDVSPAPLQEGVGLPPRAPSEQAILEGVRKFQPPTILADIGQEQGDDRIYAPEIIITKVPSVYNTLNTQSTHDLVKQGYMGINDAAARNHAAQQAATAQTQQILEDRNRLLNVPRVDKPWNASPAENSNNPFMDILFGKEQHRKEQPFKPEEGSFGKQGAGVLGGLSYLLNLPLNLSLGAIAETNVAASGLLQRMGVKKEDAENYVRNGLLGLLPEKMRPSSLLGMDWKKAQERNLVQDALAGDPVGDTNDPKGKNKGVYFSPRRSANVRAPQIAEPGDVGSQIDQAYNDVVAVAQNDPIGTVIEVATQLFNPGDMVREAAWDAALGVLRKRTAAANVAKKAAAPTAKPGKKKTTNAATQPQSPSAQSNQVVGSATWEPPSKLSVSSSGNIVVQFPAVQVQRSALPSAAKPARAPRVLLGDVEVVQKSLPPAIPPTRASQITSAESPSSIALQVGVGVPSRKPISIPVPTPVSKFGSASTDELLELAEELAAHKVVVAAPQKQLDDLFETTVDFGRQQLDNVPFAKMLPEEVDRAIANGARLNLATGADDIIRNEFPNIMPKQLLDQADNLGAEFVRIIREADFDLLPGFVARNGIAPEAVPRIIADANNVSLDDIGKVTNVGSVQHTIAMPSDVFHGTAVADWTPNYNIRINGSRGELGSGLYVTAQKEQAQLYAEALMGENVPTGALAKDIAPATYTIAHSLESTLDARAKIASNNPIIGQLLQDLPQELKSNVYRSLQRKPLTNYAGLLDKIEANLVRSGLEPTEQTLREVQGIVSNNLRKLGYDSVYDAKSGFGLVLDETKVNVSAANAVPSAPHPLHYIVARYNADAYAAASFPNRLTTDANLRDSAAKLLNQVEDNIDNNLKRVQQEIIKRGNTARETVLPPREQFIREPGSRKPATMEEALADIEPRSSNICEP